MPYKLIDEITVTPLSGVLTHASGTSYSNSQLYKPSKNALNDSSYLIPNESFEKVYVLETYFDYGFNTTLVRLLVVPPAGDSLPMGFTTSCTLQFVLDKVVEGKIGEHGEILDTDFIILSYSTTKFLMTDPQSEQYLEATQRMVRESRPLINKKELCPGYLYQDRPGFNLIYLGESQHDGDARYKHTFIIMPSNTSVMDMMQNLRDGDVPHYYLDRSNSPKIVQRLGKAFDLTEELRASLRPQQRYNYHSRQYEQREYTWKETLPSSHSSEAAAPNVMTSEDEGSTPSASAS